MKGRINKLSKGWVVEYVLPGPPFVGELPILMDENCKSLVSGDEVNFEVSNQWYTDEHDMETMREYAEIIPEIKVPKVSKEYILCAAIWYKEIPLKKVINGVLPKNCDKGLVVLGHRHGQCMWTMTALTGLRTCEIGEDCSGEHEQGFLTNTNRFVDREEAAQIAFDAGQIKQHTITLYSEDLY